MQSALICMHALACTKEGSGRTFGRIWQEHHNVELRGLEPPCMP